MAKAVEDDLKTNHDQPKQPRVMSNQEHPGPLSAYVRLGHWKLHIRLQNPPRYRDPNYHQNQVCHTPTIKAFRLEVGAIAGLNRSPQQPTNKALKGKGHQQGPKAQGEPALIIEGLVKPPWLQAFTHELMGHAKVPTGTKTNQGTCAEEARATINEDTPGRDAVTRTSEVHPTGPGPPHR